jgi:single-strand DNA-binding protein
MTTNDVRLQGRVTRGPDERTMPSGDPLVSFRLSVPRADDKGGSDWVDCAAWSSRLRRTVGRWHLDDEVEIRGQLRRRVYRSPTGPVPLVEVEVSQARRLQPAAGVRRGDRA